LKANGWSGRNQYCKEDKLERISRERSEFLTVSDLVGVLVLLITEDVSAVMTRVTALRVVEENTVSKIEPSREFSGVSNNRHRVSEDLTDAP
jgi:hypothetical protein